jgi:hypothetical protein
MTGHPIVIWHANHYHFSTLNSICLAQDMVSIQHMRLWHCYLPSRQAEAAVTLQPHGISLPWEHVGGRLRTTVSVPDGHSMIVIVPAH